MSKLGLGLKQMDLFSQVEIPMIPDVKKWTPDPPPKVSLPPSPKPSISEGFKKIREKGYLDEKKIDEIIKENEPVSNNYRLNHPELPDSWNPWDLIKLLSYSLLVLVEIVLTSLAMWSLGDSLVISIGLVIIGVAASILGIYLFLRGDLIGVIAWVVYAILFVLLNWSWTVGNLITVKEAGESLSIEMGELKRNTELIESLTLKMVSLNQWATDTAESIERQIIGLQTRNKEIKAILEVPRETVTSTFDTMGELFGLDGVTMARYWWIGALVLLQAFSVLTAPRRKD